MRVVVVVLSLLCSACSPYEPHQYTEPPLEAPESFVFYEPEHKNTPTLKANWWTLLDTETLSPLMVKAFQNNPDVDIALARLQAAQEQLSAARSSYWPQVTTGGVASRQRFDSLTGGSPQAGIPGQQSGGFSGFQNFFSLNNSLSLELDLWKRITSRAQSARESAEAQAALYVSTKQLLAAELGDQWITALEQTQLLQLLDEQLDTSTKLQELVTLRLASGEGSALDVLQQKQQIATLHSLQPGIRRAREQSLISLSVLTGKAYDQEHGWLQTARFPSLPDLPAHITPLAVLYGRPDVESSRKHLQAAEYEVAARVADRFPALSLGLSYDFRAADIDNLFSGSLSSMAANVVLPLIDGGRRRALVRQQEALVEQRFHEYRKVALQALAEVESSLLREQQAVEFHQQIEIRLALATQTLEQAQERYVNGAESYLQVLLAVQSLQSLEREHISAQAEMLRARMVLYRSMGDLATPQLLTSFSYQHEDNHGHS